jgi:hypothetical protein
MIIHALVQATIVRRRHGPAVRPSVRTGPVRRHKPLAFLGVLVFLGLASLLTWVLLQFY